MQLYKKYNKTWVNVIFKSNKLLLTKIKLLYYQNLSLKTKGKNYKSQYFWDKIFKYFFYTNITKHRPIDT